MCQLFEVEDIRTNPATGREGGLLSGPEVRPRRTPRMRLHSRPVPRREKEPDLPQHPRENFLCWLHTFCWKNSSFETDSQAPITLGAPITLSTNPRSGLSLMEWRSDHTAFWNNPGWQTKRPFHHEFSKSTGATSTTSALNLPHLSSRSSGATFQPQTALARQCPDKQRLLDKHVDYCSYQLKGQVPIYSQNPTTLLPNGASISE